MMDAGRNGRFVLGLLAWGLGAIFVYAAVLKIRDPAAFAQAIKYYKLMPLGTVNAMALLLPWWELAAGLAILVPHWRRAGAGVIFALLLVFTVAVGLAIARGLDISCGCFGTASRKNTTSTLLGDLGMLAAAWIVLTGGALRRSPFFPRTQLETPTTAAQGAAR